MYAVKVAEMEAERTSLRSLVDKWLAPTHETPLRVIDFGRTATGARYISLEVVRMAGPLTIAFFRHDDGAWRVFPPAPVRALLMAI
jgi:hypothetical protein